MTEAQEILALLRELDAKVDRLLHGADHALITAIRAAVQETAFTSGEVLQHAAVDPALAVLLGNRSARSLGKLLAAHPEAFSCIGETAEGKVWRCAR